MPYTINDANGYLSFGPSIDGWRQTKALVQNQKTWPHPAFDHLMEHGYTNLLVALSVECRYLESQTDDQDIKEVLSHLGGLTKRADEIIALEL